MATSTFILIIAATLYVLSVIVFLAVSEAYIHDLKMAYHYGYRGLARRHGYPEINARIKMHSRNRFLAPIWPVAVILIAIRAIAKSK